MNKMFISAQICEIDKSLKLFLTIFSKFRSPETKKILFLSTFSKLKSKPELWKTFISDKCQRITFEIMKTFISEKDLWNLRNLEINYTFISNKIPRIMISRNREDIICNKIAKIILFLIN